MDERKLNDDLMNSFVQIRFSQLYQWIYGFNLSRVLANRNENRVAIALSKMKVVIFVIARNKRFEAEADQRSRNEAERILWDYDQKNPVALRDLTVMMLGECLFPARVTCARLAESISIDRS